MNDRLLTRLLLGAPAVLGLGLLGIFLLPALAHDSGPHEVAAILHSSVVPIDLPPVVQYKPDFSDQVAVKRYFGRTLTQLRGDEFPGLHSPVSGDWRSGPGRSEAHQTFAMYKRSRQAGSRGKRRALVLRPVGGCPKHMRPVFEQLEQFLTAYFDRPTRWGRALPFPRQGLRMVVSTHGAHAQFPVLPSLRILVRSVPKDALSVLGVTCTDLYQKAGNRYLFGYGTLRHRAGICSVARMYPVLQTLADPVSRSIGLLRSFKLIAHETGHTLGLHHCTRSQCVMNGVNSLREVDGQPLHLCPLCLSKLAWHLRFDVRERYRRLGALLARMNQPAQAAWYRRQYLRLVTHGPGPTMDNAEEDRL